MQRLWRGVWAGAGLLLLTHCAHRGDAVDEQARKMSGEIAEIMVAHHAIDAAVPLVQRGLADDPNNPRMHTLMGILLRDRGLFAEARRELTLAYQLEPRDLDTVVAMGMLLDLMGDGVAAEVWHKRAIGMDDQHAELYNNLGFSHYLRHEYSEAVVAYKQALERDPSAHRVYNNLGFALARLGQYEDALANFERASGRGGALANMGVAYELQGKLDTAKDMYQQALRADRTLKMARTNLESLNKRLKGDPAPETPGGEES